VCWQISQAQNSSSLAGKVSLDPVEHSPVKREASA
jgi:hypothetical protein